MERAELNRLVAKAIAGKPDAMNDLINASYQDMYYYALKIVKSEDLAADATQDSCIEIIRTIHNLKESAAFITWCRRIVYHQCTKRIGPSRLVPLEENEDGETIIDRIPDEAPNSLPEEVAVNKEFRQIMLDMIDALPMGQRSALMLYYYERLSIKQIAQIQDENENTIKSRLRQGRNAVKKKVEDYEAKTGTKLYSVGIIPLLYFLLHCGRTEADAASAMLAPQVQAAVATAAGTAGLGASAATGAAASTSLIAKISAAVIAVAVAVGGVILATRSGDKSSEVPTSGTSLSTSDNGQGHTHSSDTLGFDAQVHFQISGCGEFYNHAPHTFADGECTVCRMIQPLPSGNPLLTYDCASLTGHWIDVYLDRDETDMADFYISGDGSIVANGKTYYPIGNEVTREDLYGNQRIGIYFGTRVYDPDAPFTIDEMYTAPVFLELQKTNEGMIMDLHIADPDTPDTVIGGKYYRESDYFGYEKVELTLENYTEYLTVTLEPLQCTYRSFPVAFFAGQYIRITLRDDLGFISWCDIQGTRETRYCLVESNLNTGVNEVTLISDPESQPLIMHLLGYEASKYLEILNGETFPINGMVKWYGDITETISIDTVLGYVYVPIQ